MSRNYIFFLIVFLLVFPAFVFAQQGASALRDYVGLINQSYHPGIVSYFEKVKKELAKEKETDAVRNIEIFLSGAFGSGFLYNDARGHLYVITNNHVVAQAHTVSITFERADGAKRKVENLKIIATDEEADLAILSIPAGGERLFVTQGLTLLTDRLEEGINVFSAGFPGLGVTPLWQFGTGIISNSSARFPKSLSDQTLIGPFIQHTAQVDAGNSGGPLLIARAGVPSGYAVAGINTLRATTRQAANYAIPISTVQTFINSALNPRPDTFRADLDQRLEKFISVLNGKTNVYPNISEFLSAVCIGENAEYAFEEMYEKAPKSVSRVFIQKCEDSIVGAMGIAIGWTIEESVKSRGAFTASIKEVTGAGEEYTVVFTINSKDVSSVWIREYGNWRIKTFGSAATGDTDRIAKRQADRDAAAKLRLRSFFSVEAGYASLFDKAPAAFYAGLELANLIGFRYFTAGPDFSAIGVYTNLSLPFPINSNFGMIPFIRFGVDYHIDQDYENFKKINISDHNGFDPYPPPVSVAAMVGLKITTSYVPGLFVGIGFQYNLFNLHTIDPLISSKPYKNPMNMGLTITAGYLF